MLMNVLLVDQKLAILATKPLKITLSFQVFVLAFLLIYNIISNKKIILSNVKTFDISRLRSPVDEVVVLGSINDFAFFTLKKRYPSYGFGDRFRHYMYI